MILKKLQLINEQTSPLFRLMSIDNVTELARRRFSNNICAFHIGNGFILSVAHNIRTEAQIVQWFESASFDADVLPLLTPDQVLLFNKCYPLDVATGKRYLTIVDQLDFNTIVETLKAINYDTRWLTLAQKNICNPFLVIQFTNNEFYNTPALNVHFDAAKYFHEPTLNKHTYLIEVELVEAFYKEDIALYKIINTHTDIIARIPKLAVDFTMLDTTYANLFCLQSSPSSALGRLLNQANIEGYLDQHQTFGDRIGGNYIFEGVRYLIKGYFRFGSSGAPYIYYNEGNDEFMVTAIQSEACPIQLLINNSQAGNFQYVNALASPLNIIRERLQLHLNV